MAKGAPIRRRIFVGCEGASERSYVRWLQGLADEREKHLFFDPYDLRGGDPLGIVERAERKLKEQERRKGKYAFKAVIIDSDRLGIDAHRDRQIDPILDRSGLVLLKQEEIHEALLLRHFDKCSKLRPSKTKTVARLLREWPNYDKPEDAISLRSTPNFDSFNRMTLVEPDFDSFFGSLIK